ncbi:MAG: nucleotide exchange factor GrpE [Sedimentisphaerales bacterium]
MNEEIPKEPVEQQKQEQQNPPADSEIHAEHKKDKLHKQIDKLRAEKDEVFARLQRLSADYQNYQKRTAKQIAESITYEKEVVIKSLLPVLDNLDHTIINTEKLKDSGEVLKGIKIIYDQFLAVLKTHGIEQIIAVGATFDPECHQAVMQKTEPDKEDGAILEELRKGYRLGDKILRPSSVVVNKKKEEPQPDTDNKDNGE